MRKIAVFLTLSAALAAAPAAAVTNFSRDAHKFVPAPLVEPARDFPLGESLVYDVYWLGFHVGVGEIRVREKALFAGREAYHVVGTARANEFLSRIFHVRDEAHSWIDAETLESLRFEKTVEEGESRRHERDTFDPSSRRAFHENLKTGEAKTFETAEPVQDALSVFYWFRRQRFAPGETVRTTLSCDQKAWALEVDVVRQQVENLRGQGVVDAIVVQPRPILDGEPERRGHAWVYLRNDARRTPVFVKFKTPFGPVIGVLRSGPSRSAPSERFKKSPKGGTMGVRALPA